jgi:hypothetical protein
VRACGVPHTDQQIEAITAKAQHKVYCHRCEARDRPLYCALNLPKWLDCCRDPSAMQIGIRAVLECPDCAVMGTMELMLQDKRCFQALVDYERQDAEGKRHSYAQYSIAFFVSGDQGSGSSSRCLDREQYENSLNDSFPLGELEWQDFDPIDDLPLHEWLPH